MTNEFVPWTMWHALAPRVLAVAATRVEGTWSAYIDAVPGRNHANEHKAVLANGTKLDGTVACELFPSFSHIPYAP